MIYLIIGILAIGVLAAILELISRYRGEDMTVHQAAASDCTTCTGADLSCEQTCMMEAAVKPIEYFDDEELDVFAHRPSNQYTEEETEMFSRVLYTLRPQEVRPWARSLRLREIELPDQLKDEFIAMA